ncbi:hypothetical protein [Fluviispira vulneris]|uniref:hypothetical protein n=1 Tax=Fluviispira vulneris TaxID=2763012 RepID=UPI0016470CAB|nr:hypothetical protein [Fluviispira vulneris]
MLQAQNDKIQAIFEQAIAQHLKNAKVSDAREIDTIAEIKTEYISEFSLEVIAGVVTRALKALEKAKDPTVKTPATDEDAIEAYIAVVNSVAEAAKSSASSSSSLSFSMCRLSPGLFAFLYAVSTNIKDEDTFGTEAVCSTAIYYSLMESIEDVKNEATFQASLIDANNLLNMKTLQAGLTEDLKNKKITIETWLTKDQSYSKAIKQIEERLANAHFKPENSLKVLKATITNKIYLHIFI